MSRGKELVIVMVCLNAAAAAMTACPGPCLGQNMGVSPQTGIDSTVEQANTASESVNATQNSDQFGGIVDIIRATGDTITLIFEIAFAFPILLTNIGLPTWAVALISAPVYVITGITVISFLRGAPI